MGDWEAALAHAQKAVTNSPKDDDAWSMLGRAEVFLGDTASAVQHYEKAVEYNPKLATAVLDLTSLYVSMERMADAERVVAAAEKKDSRGKIDEIKVARALILGKQGKIAEATAILASATGKHPDNPLYPRMLARIYRNAGVPDLAAINYEKAWTLDQGDADLAFEYGQTLLNLKRYDEANRLFAIVQERDPDNKSVDYLRGRLLHAAGRFAEASSELEKAVEKSPEDFLSNYWLGIAYLDFARSTGKNVYGLAIAPLNKALELRPERKDVATQLGLAIFEQGKFNYRLASQDTTDE
ncbi:tetratricopeptide repeat protein, partial [bacterium]|nr:tetratricopeptide repeat protein [bacterium]